jgi:hypothetical protein
VVQNEGKSEGGVNDSWLSKDLLNLSADEELPMAIRDQLGEMAERAESLEALIECKLSAAALSEENRIWNAAIEEAAKMFASSRPGAVTANECAVRGLKRTELVHQQPGRA